jgi:hypothetical protein
MLLLLDSETRIARSFMKRDGWGQLVGLLGDVRSPSESKIRMTFWQDCMTDFEVVVLNIFFANDLGVMTLYVRFSK